MTWVRTPIALFLVATLAITGVAAAALAMRAAVRSSDVALSDAALDLGGAERLRGLRERVSRMARTFLLSGDDRFLREGRDSEAAFRDLLSTLHGSAKTPRERQLIERLTEREGARRVVAERLVDDRRSGVSTDLLVRTLEGELQPILDTLDATIAGLVEYHQHNVDRARADSAAAFSRAASGLWVAAGLALFVSLLASLALGRTLRQIEGRAQQTYRHLAAIVESSEDAVYSQDLEGRIESWNQSAERIFGYQPHEIIGRHVSALAPPGLAEDLPQILASVQEGERIPHLQTMHRARDGRIVDVVLTISPVRDEEGHVISASIIARDVTEDRRLRRERDRFFELSLDMVCIAGTDGYFKQLNPAFETVLGYTGAELLGRPFVEFVHIEDHEATLKEIEKLSMGEPTIQFENRYRCKDGTYKWLSWRASPDATGMIYAVARDVTESKSSQQSLAAATEELRVMAVVDELTGLHNRRGFNILAEHHLEHAHRCRQKAAFFFADLDGLKQINDKLGHDAGDQAIRDTATLLLAAFRKSDIVARLGGDEFVVLGTDARNDTQAPIDRLQRMVRQYNSTEPARPFTLAISIGSTTYDPDEPEAIDAILKRADKMMYEHKATRKAAIRVSTVQTSGQPIE